MTFKPMPARVPQRIDLKTGFSCNNRCTFCVQGDKRFEYGDKSTEELKALLALGRKDADGVVFTGGEVTIRKDLPELVSHARELGYTLIQLQTNGRMLVSMKFVEKLVQSGVTEFSPALHGPDPQTHNLQTRAAKSFEQTVRGIRNVKKLGLPILMNSVITKSNYEQLPQMARLFVSLGVDQFQFAFVHALGTAGSNIDQVMPRFSDVQPYLLTALAIGHNAGVQCMVEAVPLCFLPEFERFAAEWIIPHTKIFDANRVIEDYTQFRNNEGKIKGEVCKGCEAVLQCEGPWREYPEQYGWDEFKPIRTPSDG